MSTTRRRASRLAAVLGGVVVALLAGELILRLATPTPASEVLRGLHVPRPDRKWLYGLAPGARRSSPEGDVEYAINGDGFRDREHRRDKSPGTFRALVIGDSIAFGYGVALEDTFVKQIEGRLRESGGAAFEVLNLGVSGYNPYTEAELLDDVGVAYQPDLVLTQFCINDLNDPTMHFDTSTMLEIGTVPDAAFPDPSTRRATPEGARFPALRELCRRSRLCAELTSVLSPGEDRAEMVRALAPHENPSPGELAWLQGLYARMLRTSRAHGARFVLVVFPYQSQLADGRPSAVQDALVALGARAGFPVIDLLPAFRRAAAADASPLFLDLWHPTRRGQKVAADEIVHQLACDGLLPDGVATCAP